MHQLHNVALIQLLYLKHMKNTSTGTDIISLPPTQTNSQTVDLSGAGRQQGDTLRMITRKNTSATFVAMTAAPSQPITDLSWHHFLPDFVVAPRQIQQTHAKQDDILMGYCAFDKQSSTDYSVDRQCSQSHISVL